MSKKSFAIRRFDAGRINITPGAQVAIRGIEIAVALLRHMYADWGFLTDEDRLANEFALEHQLRLLSVYEDSNGKRFWIITEADRSATTILLPEEYQ
jgi:hypothetical protein